MTIITRFAPAPTGFLHLGNIRTALFNCLYAHEHNGKYLVRIEDTNKKLTSTIAINSILDDLSWLGIKPDQPVVYQSDNIDQHKKTIDYLLSTNKAYYDYETCSEKPVVRLKCNTTSKTIVKDLVQGNITFDNKNLDDYILARSDGTPTYMLASVVDDINMKITHIIRGDDHINNAFRQIQLYKALNADIPNFAHIPLIHDSDKKKLSKRNNSLSLKYYKDEGYLPEALQEYLMSLSFPSDQKIFDIKKVKKSSATLNISKIKSINKKHLYNTPKSKLLPQIIFKLAKFHPQKRTLNENEKVYLSNSLDMLISRSKTINDIVELSQFCYTDPFQPLNITSENYTKILKPILNILLKENVFEHKLLNNSISDFASTNSFHMSDICNIVRKLLTNSDKGLDLFIVMEILGKKETIKRLKRYKIC